MPSQSVSYWSIKTPSDNAWHPQIGQCPTRYTKNFPTILQRTDIEATLVDAAPYIASVGALRHASQAYDIGFTVSAKVFKNFKTLNALHKSTLLFIPLVLSLQAAGIEYRNLIPRWSTDRERYRQEEEVRQHVDVGAYLGALSWIGRMITRVGVRYWAPIDVVLGGAGADVLHREYFRTHSLCWKDIRRFCIAGENPEIWKSMHHSSIVIQPLSAYVIINVLRWCKVHMTELRKDHDVVVYHTYSSKTWNQSRTASKYETFEVSLVS